MKEVTQFIIARPKPDAASRLICFPHAGGGPVAFFDWAQNLGPDIECVALQYAGRAQRLRDAPCLSTEELVRDLQPGFASLMDKPFSFYGHSFGGIVAFEVARELRHSGWQGPEHLFVGAARPPHLELPFPPIHQLADKEFVEKLQARYGGIPAVIFQNAEAMEMFLPALRADFTAYETYYYLPGNPLDVPITAFAGIEDRAVVSASVQEWAMHTTAGFDIHDLPGGHFFCPTSLKDIVRSIATRICTERNKQTSMLAG